MPRHWLNLIGDPAVRKQVSESIKSVKGRTELRTTDADVALGAPAIDAVVMDHNTAKAWLLIAGALRESGRLVVYIGREQGDHGSMSYVTGKLGCFRVAEPVEFDHYFGTAGRWRPPEPDTVRFGRPDEELAELETT